MRGEGEEEVGESGGESRGEVRMNKCMPGFGTVLCHNKTNPFVSS